MASISVFLNSHLIVWFKEYMQPLHALCSLDNRELLTQHDIILVCSFSLTIPSHNSQPLTNSSCVINCNIESQCATEINLDFLKVNQRFYKHANVAISYNVIAYRVDIKSSSGVYTEYPDITDSLIQTALTLPPVTILFQNTFYWRSILNTLANIQLLHVGVKPMSTSRSFPLRVNVDPLSNLTEFRIRLSFGPRLRYMWSNPVQGHHWQVSVVSHHWGAIVHGRLNQTDRQRIFPVSTGSAASDKPSSSSVITDLMMEQLAEGEAHNQPGVFSSPPYGQATSAGQLLTRPDPEVMLRQTIASRLKSDAERDSEDSLLLFSPQPIISVQVEQMAFKADSTVDPAHIQSPHVLISAPTLAPSPQALHPFVIFEPRDILEPPWLPAVPTLEPSKLEVVALRPTKPVAQSSRPFGTSSGQPTSTSAGQLLHITDQIHCRPAAIAEGERDHFLYTDDWLEEAGGGESPPTAHQPCPPKMQLAPRLVEELPQPWSSPLGTTEGDAQFNYAAGGLGARRGWADQIVLAHRAVGQGSTLAPSLYGSLRNHLGHNRSLWDWREWRRPTVRRWMFEGFRIRLGDGKTLRRISRNWEVPYASMDSKNATRLTDRYEQVPIVVTSRIYTTRPGSAQRIYLGSEKTSSPPGGGPRDSGSPFPEVDPNTDTGPTEFDITRLLPPWTLVVRQLAPAGSEAAAYIHFDAHTGRPHLIGRQQGQVVVSLVARRNDAQPLATATIEIGDRDTLEVVAMRAECVDSEVRLSGQLTAAPISIRREDPLDPRMAALFSDLVKSVYDLSLPRPHKLTVQLTGTSDSTGSGSLITAAASSTPHRLLSSLRSSAPRMNRDGLQVGDEIMSSSATCPVHRLAVSLLLSDGSLLSTHLVPRLHLRIGMLNSPLTWDPAVSFQSAGKSSGANSRPGDPDSDGDISPEVLINRLIVWPGVESVASASIPLAAMDEVSTAVKNGLSLKDPGPAKDPAQLISAYRQVERKLKSSDQKILKEAQLSRQNRTRTQSGDRGISAGQLSAISMGIMTRTLPDSQGEAFGNRMPTLVVVYILLGVTGFVIVVILVNVGVCYTLRRSKREALRQGADGAEAINSEQTPSGLDKDLQWRRKQNQTIGDQCLGYSSEQVRYKVCANGAVLAPMLKAPSPGMDRDYRSIPCIAVPIGDAVPPAMAGGLSCSSVCSGNSCGQSGSFRPSLNKHNSNNTETMVNPYLIASDVTSSMVVGQTVESPFGFPPPHSLAVRYNPGLSQSGLTVSGSWSPPPEGYFNSNVFGPRGEKQALLQALNPIEGVPPCCPMDLSLHPPNSVGTKSPRNQPLTRLFSTSGDTDEGCSDEGVASGAEACHLSTELVNRRAGFDPLRPRLRPLLGTNQTSGATSPHHTGGSGSTISCGTGSFAQPGQLPTQQILASSKYYNPTVATTVHSSLSGEESSLGDASGSGRGGEQGLILYNAGEISSVCSKWTQRPTDCRQSPQQWTDCVHPLIDMGIRHQPGVNIANAPQLRPYQPVDDLYVEAQVQFPAAAAPPPPSKLQGTVSPVGKTAEIPPNGYQGGEDSDVESLPVSLPPMMQVLNYACPTDFLNQQIMLDSKTNKFPNAEQPGCSPNSSANHFPPLYKRSDSFGMATKQILPPVTTATTLELQSSHDLHQVSKNDDLQGIPLCDANIRSRSKQFPTTFPKVPFCLIESSDEMVGEVSDTTTNTTSSGSRPYGDASSNEKGFSKCHINLTTNHEVHPVNGDHCDVKPTYLG